MNDRISKISWIVWSCILIVIFLAGCSHKPKPSALDSAKGSFDDLRAAVLREIKDPDRAAQCTGLVDQLEKIMIEANADRKTHDARLRSLNANYEATEEDFRVAFRDFNAKRRARQDRILEINQRAKIRTTDDEWKALIKAQDEMIQKALEAGRVM